MNFLFKTDKDLVEVSRYGDILLVSVIPGQTTCGIFAGAAIYIALVQVPSWTESLNNNELIVNFKSFYHRAARMQASMTVISAGHSRILLFDLKLDELDGWIFNVLYTVLLCFY